MTNKEIKFELAKVALSSRYLRQGESLEELYKWIIEEPEKEVIPEQPVNDYEQKPIREVYLEIQRIEEAEVSAKKQQGRVSKKGHARRFFKRAQMADIETVGQLLNFGKDDFLRLQNMGRQCVEYVSMALKNLYGIDKW